MTDSADRHRDGAGIWSYLASCLWAYKDEHEDLFEGPKTHEEHALHDAMAVIESHAIGLISTGQVSGIAAEELGDFMPGASLDAKVCELLKYNYVQELLEFAVAEEAVDRLDKLARRVRIAVIAFMILQRCDAPATAVKYLERASRLFLAGYSSEVTIMCGAVVEAALASRFPDDVIRQSGMKPAFQRTGVFAVSQRMAYERMHPVFAQEERDRIWKIVNWRNDAVHVQPDMGPDADFALLMTASALVAIQPRVL